MPGTLSHEYALPDDPELDRFDSGEDEASTYFRSRRWFNAEKGQVARPTYGFRTEEGGPVIGYAAVPFRNAEHPDDRSAARAKYLRIHVVGVNRPYQGRRNPLAPDETFAASMYRVIEDFAVTKAGFVADPSGPVARNPGAPH